MSAPQPDRPMLRCGRTDQPVLHLVEADDALLVPSWRGSGRQYVALCAELVDEDTPVPDFEVCPGCVDCTRYCSKCVANAARFAEQPEGAGGAEGGVSQGGDRG